MGDNLQSWRSIVLAGGSAMVKQPYDAIDRLTCPECGSAMEIIRRVPHSARHEFEKQTIACTKCNYSTTRTVDAADRPLR